MNIIQAKNFSNRAEIDNHIRNLTGMTVDQKTDHQIKGTRNELERLGLSDRNIFWGIKCIISDDPTTPTPQREKPNRGEVQPFGINLNKK